MTAETNEYQYCVVIPTYNNDKTLKSVVDGVLNYFPASQVLIVNDGSTDNTTDILAQYSNIAQLHIPQNTGKGFALRQGFKKALDLGFTHVITIDSDGQHFPEDIPNLLQASQNEPDALLIGARNMEQEGVPSKSSFGNKFSNFWFRFETGIKLSDTQSGFRVYPIAMMPKKWYSKKFEFEIECIVRSAWNGVKVKNHPIQIKYESEENRVSHFRPVKDFSRISIINFSLIFVQFTYIIPRNFFRNFKKKSYAVSYQKTY